MIERKKWSHEELALALNLYCRLPFGRMHARNPSIIKLAEYMGRTPGAVAMKLVNFVALDATLSQRGLSGCSKLDREVWEEFITDETLFLRTEEVVEKVLPLDALSLSCYASDDAMAIVKVRRQQSFFRNMVVVNYGTKCCITGLAISDLLVASHIVPWKVDRENRLNPHNGLCLNSLHDRAFDKGFITIGSDYRVILSKVVLRNRSNAALLDFEGQRSVLPDKFMPSLDFLVYHNQKIFKG